MSNVKPLPLRKPPLKEQKASAAAEVESATGEIMPEGLKKVLFKSITKTSNGSMRAEELNAITEACKGYLEVDALVSKKR